jgi:hypothetical protein
MDDANVPSLLSLPYLGYCAKDSPTYQNTRAMILSPQGNPYYNVGEDGAAVGSPHTWIQHVWPMSLVTQIYTSDDDEEIRYALAMLTNTTSGLGLMHESFYVHDSKQFTRSWFACKLPCLLLPGKYSTAWRCVVIAITHVRSGYVLIFLSRKSRGEQLFRTMYTRPRAAKAISAFRRYGIRECTLCEVNNTASSSSHAFRPKIVSRQSFDIIIMRGHHWRSGGGGPMSMSPTLLHLLQKVVQFAGEVIRLPPGVLADRASRTKLQLSLKVCVHASTIPSIF